MSAYKYKVRLAWFGTATPAYNAAWTRIGTARINRQGTLDFDDLSRTALILTAHMRQGNTQIAWRLYDEDAAAAIVTTSPSYYPIVQKILFPVTTLPAGDARLTFQYQHTSANNGVVALLGICVDAWAR